ncbi:unnamed protein product [Spirodela intermedia]|uniref:Uncharacterized protein n=1 Tax=Spirodela intermedia TaxID=51605 RepID=A0A7I8IWN9_SPIIN|nr:unnamed protein product [Spirodela intermedia]CAA6662094.1 unnamed protein product [Spirodela intermedia]
MKLVAETTEPLLPGLLGELWRRALELGRSLVSPENPPENWPGPEMETEIDDLRSLVEGINAVLGDADRRNFEEASVLLWLRSLREVALDFEDVDDEVETVLRDTPTSSPLGFLSSSGAGCGRRSRRSRLGIGSSPEAGRRSGWRRRCGQRRAGRDRRRRRRRPCRRSLYRSGQARLQRREGEEALRREEDLDLRRRGGFNLERITAEILESLTGEPSSSSNLYSFDLIQRKVRQRLTEGGRSCWCSTAWGRRVLGTGTISAYRQKMSGVAAGGDIHRRASPRRKREEEWERVLREMEAFPLEENDILPQLNLTYALLPLPLKKCFAFCGIFPRAGGGAGFYSSPRVQEAEDLISGGRRRRIDKLPADLLPQMRFLRALDLNDSAVRELPDSTKIELLPESVAALSNLQTLELSHCYELRMLPKGTSELTNLRHLGLHVDQPTRSKLQSTPPGIGRLRSLETLSRFIVGTEDGCGLSQMKDLKLRGELWISKLENVRRPEDARQANLRNKDYLDSLTLEWSDPRRTLSSALTACLQLVNYDGATAPSWLPSDGAFRDLSFLSLSNCRRWRNLPELGRLPALKELLIEESMALLLFPALEKLTLSDLPALERWAVSEGEMPRLSELSILSCPSLVDLPHLPSSLTKLKVRGCGALLVIPRPDSLETSRFIMHSLKTG